MIIGNYSQGLTSWRLHVEHHLASSRAIHTYSMRIFPPTRPKIFRLLPKDFSSYEVYYDKNSIFPTPQLSANLALFLYNTNHVCNIASQHSPKPRYLKSHASRGICRTRRDKTGSEFESLLHSLSVLENLVTVNTKVFRLKLGVLFHVSGAADLFRDSRSLIPGPAGGPGPEVGPGVVSIVGNFWNGRHNHVL